MTMWFDKKKKFCQIFENITFLQIIFIQVSHITFCNILICIYATFCLRWIIEEAMIIYVIIENLNHMLQTWELSSVQ